MKQEAIFKSKSKTCSKKRFEDMNRLGAGFTKLSNMSCIVKKI